MSKRTDIIEPYEWTANKKNGLVYSEILGWIDIGHAQGNDITSLLWNFRNGESGKSPYYRINYTQKMHIFGRRFGAGKFVCWDIKKGRTQSEIYSIALAMMMQTARIFENYQAQWFFSWYTDSGYSCEDLTSDLLGFYKSINGGYLKSQLKLVSKNKALRRWDYYGPVGNYKNKGFQPLLFPDPDNPCIKLEPYKTHLPDFMKRITPYKDFRSDTVRIVKRNGQYFSFLPIR